MAKVDAAEGESASFPAPLNQGPVEARSLSSITAIASNPPNYPRNPAQRKLDPLVLYIVRVPGSRDVFLTPLKPPTKSSVSAEAINASLYYLHVASPDDENLLQEYEQEREERARLRKEGLIDDDPDLPIPPLEVARLNNVKRKPVAVAGAGAATKDVEASSTLPSPMKRRPVPSTLPVQEGENSSSAILSEDSSPVLPPRPTSFNGPNPALVGDQTPSPVLPPRPTSFKADEMPSPVLPPRPTYSNTANLAGGMEESRPPMPPRPLPGVPQQEYSSDNRTPPKKTNRWSALSGYISNHVQRGDRRDASSPVRHSFDVSRPQLRPSSSHDPSMPRSPPAYPARSPGQSPTRRPRRDTDQPQRQPGFHITLIRRDPSHGSQWNVATMSTPHLDSTSIDIEVSTPGYSRFASQNESLSLESLSLNLPAEARSLLSRHPHITIPSDPPDTSAPRDPSQPRRFHRKLLVSRPHNQEEARNSRGSLDFPGGRPSMDSISGASINTQHPASSKLKTGYYTFTSLWNGTCTFSASVNGRSLKCKHMIPSPGFSNPTQENPAVTVAEIRFNTPFQTGHLQYPGSQHASPFLLSQSTILKDPSAHHDPSAPYYYDPSVPPPSKRAAIANLINQRLNRRPSNSSSSDGGGDVPPPLPVRRPPDDERIDLSLAREKAGGGMRGDSAKLGKLVIEDEGIKMLDLVVAASMAVWWRGYYY
ncbi:hypothetical protein BDW74DRAFT_174813 [Aspergillus multicolor]|uniref:uncharacterized protein n=1 Tax=Aspergillus multicolor TaxID=41759 RepID=UPI003CCDBFE6